MLSQRVEINPDEGLIFGKENVDGFGDGRSIRSLITYAKRTGDGRYAQALLEKYSEELDKDFTTSQKASIDAMEKRDLARRLGLSEIPEWYRFDLPNREKKMASGNIRDGIHRKRRSD